MVVVLNEIAAVGQVRAADIKTKLRSDRTTAHDSVNNPIRQGALIKISVGARKGLEGTVQHMYHSTIFVRSKIAVEDCGMIAVSATASTCLHSALRDAGGKGPLMKKKRPNSLMNSDAKTLLPSFD